MCRYNPDLTIAFINKTYSVFFQKDPSQLIGGSIWPQIPKKERERLQSHFSSITPQNPKRAIEYEIIAPDGTVHWLNWEYTGVFDPDGRVIEYHSSGRDVTDQKIVQVSLDENEGHLRSLMQTAANFALYRLKTHQNNPHMLEIIFVSPSIVDILGIDAPMNFDSWFDHMHPDDVQFIAEANRKAFETHRFNEIYRTYNPQRKEIRWIHAISTGVFDETGATHYVNGIIFDVTDQKRLEVQLLQYQNRLKALAVEMTKTQERERRRLATELHDHLGQNLAMAKFQLEMALDELEPTEHSSSLQSSVNLIDQAITDTRSIMYDLAPPALYELGLNGGLKYLASKFEWDSDLRVRLSTNGHLKDISDEVQHTIYYACKELLTNVVKHARAKNIDVSLTHDNGYLKLEVKDDGQGFDFSRNLLKIDSQGGFGLFALRERVEFLGGVVDYETEKDKGARISVSIPVP